MIFLFLNWWPWLCSHRHCQHWLTVSKDEHCRRLQGGTAEVMLTRGWAARGREGLHRQLVHFKFGNSNGGIVLYKLLVLFPSFF